MKQQKWVFLGTGGTIAGSAATAGDNVGYTAAQVGIEALLHDALPAKAGPCLHWVCEQVAQVDSKDMDFSVWTALVQRCQQHLDDPLVGGLVITHGNGPQALPAGHCGAWPPLALCRAFAGGHGGPWRVFAPCGAGQRG